MPKNEQAEQDLSKIEYMLRKDLAPSLYRDHNMGFQLLETDDEETKAVGVRAFKIGEDLWLYGVIFLIDGKAKGDELLYVVNYDLMVPFEEDWVNYLLSKDPLVLGEAADKVKPDNPDLASFKKPPTANKATATAIKSAMVKLAEESNTVGHIDLAGALADADESAKEGMRQLLLGNTKVAEALFNSVEGLLDKLEPRGLTKLARDLDAAAYPPAMCCEDEKTVKVLVGPGETADPSKQKEIASKGYTTVDNRSKEETAEILETGNLKFVQPGKTAFYDVMTAGGPVEALVIVAKPLRQYRDEWQEDVPGPEVKVVFWNDKSVVCPEGEYVAVNNGVTDSLANWEKKYNDAPKSTEVKPHKDYILIGPRMGEVLGPCYIHDVVKLPNGQVELHRSGKNILITTSSGTLTESKDQVTIPHNWKIIETKQGDAILSSPTSLLANAGKTISVKSDLGNINIKGDTDADRKIAYSIPDAMKILVEGYNLSEKDAEAVLEKSASAGEHVWLIKEAQPPGLMPPMDPSMMGGGMAPMGPGGMPPMDPAVAPPPTDPNALQASQMAGQAVDSGQSDVLDVASLSTLLSTSDNLQFIKKYLGDLLKAVDRLGRILFVLYWYNDEYAEAFGNTELNDLEQQLVNDFKSLGDTVLTLKEKVAKPDELLPLD